MKKNDLFQFIAPNGVTVNAVVVKQLTIDWLYAHTDKLSLLCYAQNRLFIASVNRTDMTNDALLEHREYRYSGFNIDEVLSDFCCLEEFEDVMKNFPGVTGFTQLDNFIGLL